MNDNDWQIHYTDYPHPTDQPITEDTCMSCYEADPEAPHTDSCLTIDYSKAPNQGMVAGIKRYVEHGIMPGHFLTALLSDKLTNTFTRADETNTPLIKEWVIWVYNEMPSDLVGSLDKMAAHIRTTQKNKEASYI